jgi:hypothetical protein
MSPFQVAQKIVQDEIQQQAQAISAQMAQQNQYNQNALSVVSQLGQQLQQGAGQFATNYNNSLAGPGGAGSQGAPDMAKASQGFNSGWQAAQGLIANGQENNPNQPGGPSQAQPLSPGVMGGDAQAYHDTAQATNPFAVLPAAYGRQAQMDATLLAANQAQGMTGYSQAIKDLFSGENKQIFDEFQQLQGLFDSANGAVTASQAAAADAASAAAAANQKQANFNASQGQSYAQWLTSVTDEIYLYNPKTGRPEPTGKLSRQGQLDNATIASKTASIQQRQQALNTQSASLNERIKHDNATIADAQASLQERRQAQADLQASRKAQQANAAARLKLAQQAAAGKTGKNNSALVKQINSAQQQAASYATSLAGKHSGGVSQSIWVDGNNNPVPVDGKGKPTGKDASGKPVQGLHKASLSSPTGAYNPAGIRIMVWRRYIGTFLRLLKAQGVTGDRARHIAEQWVTNAVSGGVRH